MERAPSPERRSTELDDLRTENARLRRRLAEMERTSAMQAAVSRILWSCTADEAESAGGEI